MILKRICNSTQLPWLIVVDASGSLNLVSVSRSGSVLYEGTSSGISFLACITLQQLQPLSKVRVQPCMEEVMGHPTLTRIGNYYQTARSQPWRPAPGYENTEVFPL
jgi:hypothetical protein